jgi:circadian clock protein KaiB
MNLEPSQVQVIDVLSTPQLAEDARILATPTLSYDHWERARRVVGDLTDIDRVLQFLGIDSKEKLKGKIS